MGARHHALRGTFGSQARPDRQTAAKRFRDRHDVGRHTPVLMREQPTRPPDAGLDFVKDQQNAFAIGDLAQGR